MKEAEPYILERGPPDHLRQGGLVVRSDRSDRDLLAGWKRDLAFEIRRIGTDRQSSRRARGAGWNNQGARIDGDHASGPGNERVYVELDDFREIDCHLRQAHQGERDRVD